MIYASILSTAAYFSLLSHCGDLKASRQRCVLHLQFPIDPFFVSWLNLSKKVPRLKSVTDVRYNFLLSFLVKTLDTSSHVKTSCWIILQSKNTIWLIICGHISLASYVPIINCAVTHVKQQSHTSRDLHPAICVFNLLELMHKLTQVCLCELWMIYLLPNAWTVTTCQLESGSWVWHMTSLISFTATQSTSAHLSTTFSSLENSIVYFIHFISHCFSLFIYTSFLKLWLDWTFWPIPRFVP